MLKGRIPVKKTKKQKKNISLDVETNEFHECTNESSVHEGPEI